MAIRFVNVEPKPKGAATPPAAREPETERPGVSPLPYAIAAPRKRGRK